jgi:BirA family biotin operon repressor/biotin-[acetyl-CoA-carboxylase] ligase
VTGDIQRPAVARKREAIVAVPTTLNIPLLARLRGAGGAYVPLDALDADRQRVQGDLDALAAFGFGIERHPYRGAAYFGPAERLCPDQIEHELDTRRIGRRVAVWSRVSSTNDLAASAGGSASNDGLVVLADEQTAGRGRRGRSWTAPPRSSILMSVVLFPPAHLVPPVPETAFGCGWLTVMGAVATADVVSAWTGRDATIKWPNDVRLGGRKIAGILVERAARAVRPPIPRELACTEGAGCGVVIGIGLNVNVDREAFPPELRAQATSLQIERDGEPVDRSELARDLIRRLDAWYDASRSHGAESLNAPWRARSEHLGRITQLATPAGTLEGRLVDLDVVLGLTLALDDDGPAPDRETRRPRRIRVPLAEVIALGPS